MAVCCGNNGTPFVQTSFMGASVVRFSAQIDWGSGGGLQVELAEDTCGGDGFNPESVGSPVSFSMGGFTHAGILQNWKQNDSATGAKTYTVNLTSPKEIIDGCQVILSSYNGPTYSVPNLANVFGYLESGGNPCIEAGYTGSAIPGFGSTPSYTPAPGFGGAFQNDIGIPWVYIKSALTSILNGGGGAYGGPISFRGHTYFLDISELPLLGGDIRIGGENMTLDALISHVCELGGMNFFYDLVSVGGGNIIRVRTTGNPMQAYNQSAESIDSAAGADIDARLSMGTIGNAISSSTCVNKSGRGLELRMDVSNSFIAGEFRQEMWQVAYEDIEPTCQGHATIWPYWGKYFNDGAVIRGVGCDYGTEPNPDDDEEDKIDHGHHFTARVGHLGIGIDTWEVTMDELRAAMAGKQNWQSLLATYYPDKFAKLDGIAEADVVKKKNHHIGLAMIKALEGVEGGVPDRHGIKGSDFVDFLTKNMEKISSLDQQKQLRADKLYDFIRNYAQEFYGKQFLVRLPFLCRRYNPDTPWTLEDNWTSTDSGWTEWPVLGEPNQSLILEQFRTTDGKFKCIMKFTSTRPMILDNLSKRDHFAVDPYNLFISGTSDEIVWVAPDDARAVVKINGPVQQYNEHGILPEWLLSLMLIKTLDSEIDREKFLKYVQDLAADKMALGMIEPVLMPTAAAVPLQSRRLTYGPWFAQEGGAFSGSDNGQTAYQREAGFAPWHFGTESLMNAVGYMTASSMLGDIYVVEMGDLTVPGAPVGTLGALIADGGPTVTGIDVQAGRGNGPVLTTYRMKTHTPDTGKLAQARLKQIRHAAKVAQKAERWFREKALGRLQNMFEVKNTMQLMQWKTAVGLAGKSSHDMLGGKAWNDYGGPAFQILPHPKLEHRKVHGKADVVEQTYIPRRYEEIKQDDEPHAKTHAIMSEGRKDMRGMRADSESQYRRRAYMESNGMFRPFSTMPHKHKAKDFYNLEIGEMDNIDDAYFMAHWRNEENHDYILLEGSGCPVEPGRIKFPPPPGCPTGEGAYMTNNVDYHSHEQVPPIFCKEHHLPVNVATLSPFLKKGRSLTNSNLGWSNGGICMTKSPDSSVGSDIEYVARDGVYPTHMSVRHPYDNYSNKHWYRAVALKAPLVLAGWGFDIDNKPVPNESTSYPNNPKMKFEQDWLRKPQKWMCGPVDLRWDYKRHVWTAPTPMKPVKLELVEHLCVEQCADAILYRDQEQYDYNGDPLDCENDCEKYGYRVKVWSNAMYPIPKGWRIMAYFDTSLNRYQLLNHDPLPLVEVKLDSDMLCEDGTGTIQGTACDGLDPCGALEGMEIELKNTLNQPICGGSTVFAWMCGFECKECEDAGDDGSVTPGNPGSPGDEGAETLDSDQCLEGPTIDDCDYKCPQPLKAIGVVLQAQFYPETVVTHLELLEYFAWGYDITCDEEDIQIYSQGDVELCWEWCMKADTVGCVMSSELYTDWHTHSHTGPFSAEIQASFSGVVTPEPHTHEFEGTVTSGYISGWIHEDTHSHYWSGEGSGCYSGVTSDHECSLDLSFTIPQGSVPVSAVLAPVSALGADVYDVDNIELTGADCAYCAISGGDVTIPHQDLADALKATVTINEFVISDTFSACLHHHDYSGCFDIAMSGVTSSDTHSHIFSGYISDLIVEGTVLPNDTPEPFSGTLSDTISGEIETNEITHRHFVEKECEEVNICQDINFDLDIDGRFIPGSCSLNIAVLNKNYWEYYWYSLCICTRTIFTQGVMGPATCALNSTPAPSVECEDIDCSSVPIYECPVPTPPVRDQKNGQDVSLLDGITDDSTLLSVRTSCDPVSAEECSAYVYCEDTAVPEPEWCCSGECEDDGSPNKVDNSATGIKSGVWNHAITLFPDYCDEVAIADPEEAAAANEQKWDVFKMDIEKGLFDFIPDGMMDHKPAGVPDDWD